MVFFFEIKAKKTQINIFTLYNKKVLPQASICNISKHTFILKEWQTLFTRKIPKNIKKETKSSYLGSAEKLSTQIQF
jgi:hypothetical protein